MVTKLQTSHFSGTRRVNNCNKVIVITYVKVKTKSPSLIEEHNGDNFDMNNIFKLENFALIFRPLKQGSDIIQLTPHTYTDKQVDSIISSLRAHIELSCIEKDSAALAFAFFCLIDSSQLEIQVAQDPKNQRYWFVKDHTSSRFFDVYPPPYNQTDINQMHSSGKAETSIFSESAILIRSFDLIVRVQPKAKRYQIEETITIENQKDSAFLNEKKAMDYLFNLGVFGTFK